MGHKAFWVIVVTALGALTIPTAALAQQTTADGPHGAAVSAGAATRARAIASHEQRAAHLQAVSADLADQARTFDAAGMADTAKRLHLNADAQGHAAQGHGATAAAIAATERGDGSAQAHFHEAHQQHALAAGRFAALASLHGERAARHEARGEYAEARHERSQQETHDANAKHYLRLAAALEGRAGLRPAASPARTRPGLGAPRLPPVRTGGAR